LSITENQHRAAGEFVDLIAGLGAGRAMHSETAIAISARMSGSLLLRSFGFDLLTPSPGTVLLSEEANQKIPQLINLLIALLRHYQIELNQSMLGAASELRGDEPELDLLQSLQLVQDAAINIASKHSLSMLQAAESATLATGFVVKECAKNIRAETAFNVAAYGLLEGCKTVPPRLAP
jgi:hypothetical protein